MELLAIEHAKTEAALRRAIRLGVREARNERKRHQELVNTMEGLAAGTQRQMEGLAAMQKVTEEKLQRFLDSRLGGNGHTS